MASRSYGKWPAAVQRLAAVFAVLGSVFALLCFGLIGAAGAAERPVQIVALGDSLTAGFHLPASAAFPVQLERALRAKGIAVEVANAGVSGDTTAGGLARLTWSVPDGTDAVILELGANDMLRGLDPAATRSALTEIVRRLKARNIEVLLCGMRSAPNLGLDYGQVFEAVFPDLAAANGLILYPFFLEGVLGDRGLVQADGLHPTKEGVAKIVTGIMPKVEALIARVRAKAKS